MPPLIDLTGQRFGRLLVLERGNNRSDVVCWVCRCDCGTIKIIAGVGLRGALVVSCGCKKRDDCLAGKPRLVHGHGRAGNRSPEFRTWAAMRNRCLNPRNAAYKDYGGRGITICAEWDSFQAFLADMGERPAGMSLDRINNEQGYGPINCRWATKSQQARNRRAPRRARPVVGAWLI